MDLVQNEIGNRARDRRMKILALENSTTRGGVVFLDDRRAPIVLDYQNDRKHSGAFFQSLEDLSDRLRDADSIVVGLGPGSYAGIRIAIATAIGLQAASGAQLFGLPSICALDPSPDEYCVIGDARRESFFFARIRRNEIVEGVDLFREAELRARLESLDGEIPLCSSEILLPFPRAIVRYPSALMLAKLIQSGVVHASKTPLQPIYLREPHITVPNDKKRNVSMLG
jgi:tRNA threonylcarbamoyladenosine biosynthesis protein TsaB